MSHHPSAFILCGETLNSAGGRSVRVGADGAVTTPGLAPGFAAAQLFRFTIRNHPMVTFGREISSVEHSGVATFMSFQEGAERGIEFNPAIWTVSGSTQHASANMRLYAAPRETVYRLIGLGLDGKNFQVRANSLRDALCHSAVPFFWHCDFFIGPHRIFKLTGRFSQSIERVRKDAGGRVPDHNQSTVKAAT